MTLSYHCSAGKSTLIKLLTGETLPDTGKVDKHPNLRVAYIAQSVGVALGVFVAVC